MPQLEQSDGPALQPPRAASATASQDVIEQWMNCTLKQRTNVQVAVDYIVRH